MAIRLITYDLNNENKRPDIVGAIKRAYRDWARLSESSYAVSTMESATGVYNRLAPLIDRDDQLYVISLSRPWTGHGPKDLNQWLTSTIGAAGG